MVSYMIPVGNNNCLNYYGDEKESISFHVLVFKFYTIHDFVLEKVVLYHCSHDGMGIQKLNTGHTTATFTAFK